MECVIVLMTHSAYIDICNNFIDLFQKNWADCPFKILGVVMGNKDTIKGIETIYIGTNGTLSDCIYTVVEKYEAHYYICFLGDAFISKKIQNIQVYNLLNELKNNNANYCGIIPKKKDLKNKKYQASYIRNIREKDIYAHSFVAFIATKEFVKDELVGKTDFEFEEKYLNIANDSLDNRVFPDHFIVVTDIFHIVPSIVKGKWDRFALKFVKYNNPQIQFSDRVKMNLLEQSKVTFINTFEGFVSVRTRKIIKKILIKIGFKFATDK